MQMIPVGGGGISSKPFGNSFASTASNVIKFLLQLFSTTNALPPKLHLRCLIRTQGLGGVGGEKAESSFSQVSGLRQLHRAGMLSVLRVASASCRAGPGGREQDETPDEAGGGEVKAAEFVYRRIKLKQLHPVVE